MPKGCCNILRPACFALWASYRQYITPFGHILPEGPLAFAPTGGQRSGPEALWLSDREAFQTVMCPEGLAIYARRGPEGARATRARRAYIEQSLSDSYVRDIYPKGLQGARRVTDCVLHNKLPSCPLGPFGPHNCLKAKGPSGNICPKGPLRGN